MNTFLNRRAVLAGGAALSGVMALPAFGANTAPGGMSQAGLKRVTATLKPFVEAEEAVGLVTLIYRKGEVAQVDALGWQDREAKIPMARNTIFRIASMTKPIVSVATLMLVDEGKLKLTDTVTKWLPELANLKMIRTEGGALDDLATPSRGITVADLLIHRAGFAVSYTTTGPLAKLITEKMSEKAVTDLDAEGWLNHLATLPLAGDVGSQWRYSPSFDVLGILIARVSGQSFPDFLQQRIFQPLGMVDTGFFVPEAQVKRVAAVYTSDANDKRTRARNEVRTAMPKFPRGGGGLYSTADDYLKFARMMLGGGKLGDVRLVSRQSIALMTTNWLTPEQRKVPFAGMEFWGGQGFGLGVAVVDDIARYSIIGTASAGSYYWPGATGTWWLADPKEDMALIYLVQNTPGEQRTPEQLARAREQQAQSSLLAFQAAAYRAIDA
jgi:CubicO group peptidase (beta-lactamase class C family)